MVVPSSRHDGFLADKATSGIFSFAVKVSFGKKKFSDGPVMFMKTKENAWSQKCRSCNVQQSKPGYIFLSGYVYGVIEVVR